jgi:phosphoribosylanthranilate isomerase
VNVRTRIKICGITSAQDAEAAVAAGADAVGVILAESARQVTLEEAEQILATIPPPIARIGVFVDAAPHHVFDAIARLRLAAVQFSGRETPEHCSRMPVPVLKAVHVGPDFSWADAEVYRECVSAILLDTAVGDKRGGTGRSFAWSTVAPVPDGLTVFLAGGLNPVNVGTAIGEIRPFAVDVSSGVEERLRHKDPDKMHAFVAAVRAADERG